MSTAIADNELETPGDFQGLQRLARDVRKAAQTLRPFEARYLVDTYYQQQDQRIRAGNRLRAAAEFGEPNGIMAWDLDNMKRREGDIKLALQEFAKTYRVGQWMLSICGVGPCISGGLLAYVDIRNCPTAGQLWRFAGLDPTLEWLGNAKADALVKEIMGDAKTVTEVHLSEVSKRTNRHVESIRNLMKGSNTRVTLISALSIRPWCGRLKTLTAFKTGECFVKVQNRESDFYGNVYRLRKDAEIAANSEKQFAEQAERILATKKIGKDTDAYKAYIQGMLPPAHIHARARRYAVKLFLSHVFQVMYEDYHGKDAPKPYAFEKLEHNHRHLISPPGWPGAFAGKNLRELLDTSPKK